MGCVNSKYQNPDGRRVTYGPALSMHKQPNDPPPEYSRMIYSVFKYFTDTFNNVSSYRFEIHISDRQMSRPADIATQKCVVDLICTALKLHNAKATVQFISYSNPAIMDGESTRALGLIDDMLACESFAELRDMWASRKGELEGGLEDNHNQENFQGTGHKGEHWDKEQDEVVPLLNKAIAEGTRSKSKGVNDQTILANMRQVLYFARYCYHQGWPLEDYTLNAQELWRDAQQDKSQDEGFVLPARFKSLLAGAAQSFKAAAETAATPTVHIILVPEVIAQSAMSSIKVSTKNVVESIDKYNKIHGTEGIRQDLFGLSIIPIGVEQGQKSRWQVLDDLRSGALDFIDCVPISHEIRSHGPGYDFLPKTTLGAVIKSLDRTKRLQFYGNGLCEIPSVEELRKFLERVREEI